jgi:hypothetical protein
LRCFFGFFLSNLDEVEVTLVLEIEKDSDSVLRFKRVCEEGGLIEGIACAFVIGPPTRVLVPRPASLTQSSCEELVDICATVSIVLDLVGAEVVFCKTKSRRGMMTSGRVQKEQNT